MCSPNLLHRRIWNREARCSVSTKIIIIRFFVAPSVSKSQPAAITGAGTNSCLEMPEAVSVSGGVHSLSSLQSNQREGWRVKEVLQTNAFLYLLVSDVC